MLLWKRNTSESRPHGREQPSFGEPAPPAPLTRGSHADERVRLILSAWVPLARELLKLAVIVVYIVLATALAVIDRNPVGFVPLLPWALGLRPTALVAWWRNAGGDRGR